MDKERLLKIAAFRKTYARRVFEYDIHFHKGLCARGAAGFLTYVSGCTRVVLDDGLPLQEQIRTLVHEVLHDILDHIPRGCALDVYDDRDSAFLWNLATDYVVDRFLTVMFTDPPYVSIALDVVNSLREDPDKDCTAEGIYRLLKHEIEVVYNESSAHEVFPGVVIVKVLYKRRSTGEVLLERYEVIHTRVPDKAEECGNVDKYMLEKRVSELAGTETVPGLEDLKVARTRLPLRKELSDYLSSSLAVHGEDVSFFRRTPRSIAISRMCGLIVPASVSKKITVVVSIDSSGSISDTTYKDFLGVLREYARFFEGKIVFHDVDAKVLDFNAHEIEELVKRGKGRRYFAGGTSLAQSVEVVNEVKPMVAIFMTDLYVNIPPREHLKDVRKVVWIVPRHDSAVPPPYGRVIFV